MSAIAFSERSPTGPSAAALVDRMLRAMAPLGRDRIDARAVDHAVTHAGALGVARADWEPGGGVLEREGIAVAADATLYHRADLRRRIGSTAEAAADHASRDDPAALILAAYRTLGDACVDALEGDFAFALWDGRRGALLAARDFGGKRALFWSHHGNVLRLASTPGGLLADPSVPRDADLATVAAVAAGLWAHGPHTGFRAIRELPAGHALRWTPGHAPEVFAFWDPPTEILTRRESMDDAAAELRALLVAATGERLAPSGPTAISLSGGWDSTAVYGAAQQALRSTGDDPSTRSLHPVSISYPEGDPGREDELIREVVAHWGGTTEFIDIGAIPMFGDAAQVERATRAAREREQPFAHAYEAWNRRLSRHARAAGARVILDGVGGDQLFQVSDIFLADLFRRGRWGELARQARIRSGGRVTARGLYRWAVRPVLPAKVARAIAAVRRAPVAPHYLERQAPFWFAPRFLEQQGVLERERTLAPPLPRHSTVLAETHAYLRYAFYPRIFGLLHNFALDEGVELRSPLLDERVVRFAVRRPWSERADGGETKLLLRHAMRGLLPDAVLAPRPHRTGTTGAYFLRQLRGPGRAVVEHVLGDLRLAALGMIDATRLRRAWEHVLTHDDDEMAGRVFFTLQAELWMRGHEA